LFAAIADHMIADETLADTVSNHVMQILLQHHALVEQTRSVGTRQ
jgi:hypothetical protein